MTLRALLERGLRSLVVRRRLPRTFGGAPLLVSAEGGLRYLFRPMGSVDSALLACVRRHVLPGDCVWDVGANLGLFAFAAAARAGAEAEVVAVEPDTYCVDLLRRTARMQPPSSAPVTVLPAAVAGEWGLAVLEVARRSRSANRLEGGIGTQTGGVRERQTVVTLPADALLDRFRPPSFVKVDIEGLETAFLRGAARLLREVRPKLLVEVAGAHAAEVADVLTAAGYALYDADAPEGAARPVATAAWNTLALPREGPLRAAGARA
jgi:FkbM family methyltransferase